MTSRCCSILVIIVLLSPLTGIQAADNELTPQEREEGYVLLFNGTDLKGWHLATGVHGGWKAQDGALNLTKDGRMLYTDQQYDNFILKLDFKMARNCNSGVFIRVGDPQNPGQTGLEIQILDDASRKEPTFHSCGSIYGFVRPKKHVTRPAGQWNTFIITANKNLITVEMNDAKICEMNLEEWDKPGLRPDGSKLRSNVIARNLPRKGLIGLQDHTSTISFKNIKLKVLK